MKVRPDTLIAADQVVEHWHRLATGTRQENETMGSNSCAFCKMYLNVTPNTPCVRRVDIKGTDGNPVAVFDSCPIYRTTGKTGCEKTPYWDVLDALHDANIATCYGEEGDPYLHKGFLEAAGIEHAFLRDLRSKLVVQAVQQEDSA